jgi:trk system potassium uptake protein TrkH
VLPWKLFRTLQDSLQASRSHRLTASRIFVLSFAGMIAVGTAGFLLLPGLYAGPRLGVVDSLFTAASAVCVTGLIVVDTATHFTFWGQLWIALLIQAGGLGILTFTTLFALALGRRAGLAVEEASGVPTRHVAYMRHGALVRTVVAVTLTIEAIGAVLLWLAWRGTMGGTGAVWPALFHAVSAFCNAGFSVFSESLAGFRGSPYTLSVVMALVVLGGLGFVVLEDLRFRFLRRSSSRLSLHSRLALVMTATLLAVSWLLFTAFEWNAEFASMTLFDRVTNGLFMAVTPRTVGFNTVGYGSVNNPSVFLTFLLMLVGGSPGSTAGGLKTVTLAILFAVLLARLRGEREVSVFRQTLPRDTVQRAVGLVVGGVVILAGAIFLLLVTELPAGGPENRLEFLMLIFEAGSAFGTVGLTMGVTPDLTGLGRIIVVCLMFVGRVGPLVLVSAMSTALQVQRGAFRYGEEDVVIG